ncbi:MAG: hypothetical protein NVSMB23_11880 [Myxococcales bacterium]
MLACLALACGGGTAPAPGGRAGPDGGTSGAADAGPVRTGQNILAVVKTANGAGTVRSTPAGIDCGATCSAIFDEGTVILLTPIPDPGFKFVGWGAGCSGAGACAPSLARDLTVYADFQPVDSVPAPDGGGPVDAGLADSGAPDAVPTDAGAADAGPAAPTLSYAATGAAACAAFQPQLGAAPSRASVEVNPYLSCGLPDSADLRGDVHVGCGGGRGDAVALLIAPSGAVLQRIDTFKNASLDAQAGRDGLIAVKRPSGSPGNQGSSVTFASGARIDTDSTARLGVQFDFEGEMVVTRTALAPPPLGQEGPTTWQRYDDLGRALTPEQLAPAAFSTPGTTWSAVPDVRGNVLAQWEAPSKEGQAQWFGPDLAVKGAPFPLSGRLQKLPEGGFVVISPGTPAKWLGAVRPADAQVGPLPAVLADRGARIFQTVFAGRAFAFYDAACSLNQPCTQGTRSAEVVAADGTSCGVLTLQRSDGSPEPFYVTPGGTLIDGLQERIPRPGLEGYATEVSRWWSNVLR